MWASLEARVPLLDHRVVELSWRMDLQTKLKGGRTKWPLRALAGEYVPLSVLDRPKTGFTAPIAEWLRSGLRDWSRDMVTDGRALLGPLVEGRQIDAMVAELDNGNDDAALPLWTIVTLCAWASHWQIEFEA